MIRTISTLIALTALAGPAAAQDISVSLAGKDARTVHVEIDKAAWTVCSSAYLKGDITFHEVADCARGSADEGEAEAKTKTSTAVASAAPVVVASNDAPAH